MKYTHPTQIPRSKTIKSIEWESELIHCASKGKKGDSFPMTWADDDEIYAGLGDPNWLYLDGKPEDRSKFSEEYLAEHFGEYTGTTVEKFTGTPENFEMTRINDLVGYAGWGGIGSKPTGMICIDGTLYFAIQNLLGWKPTVHGVVSQHGSDVSIVKSTDYGKTWTPDLEPMLTEMRKDMREWSWVTPPEERATYKGWSPMFPGSLFGGASFVQFGKNNESAVDDYVYAVSGDQWDNGTEMRVGRVLKTNIQDKNSWEFATVDGDDVSWEKNLYLSKPVLSIDRHLSAPEMVYLPSIKKYITATWGLHTDFHAGDGGELTILESDNPWGPFSLVHYEWMWGKEEAGLYCPKIPLKWFDEKTMSGYLFASGNWETNNDYYHGMTRKFKFNIH